MSSQPESKHKYCCRECGSGLTGNKVHTVDGKKYGLCSACLEPGRRSDGKVVRVKRKQVF